MRIVSLLPAATDIILALGLDDSLVACTHLCDAPPGVAIVTRPNPPSDPALAGWEVDWDAVAATRPELILTRAAPGAASIAGAFLPIRLPVDAPAFALASMSVDGMLESIQAISIECRVPETGQQVIAELRLRLDDLSARSALTRHKPVVVALEDLDEPRASGGWVPEQIRLAGGTATLVDEGETTTAVTWDDVAAVQPELFLAMARDGDVLSSLQALIALGARDDLRWLWREIPAAYLSQIYALDARLFGGPGPRLVDGIAVLAGLLHPDVFPAPLAASALRP